MNPFEHGEVFVTDDGGETDLDLGHYERFIDEPLSRGLQRHDRLDLLGRARRRAPGRLPGQDRPGDPAHHRRDQAAHQPPRRRRRRRRDHRDRRHRRRHRDPAVPRGDPAVPPRRRPRQRVLRPRHARAVHRPVGRAEDEADPALGHRAAGPRHPARRHRVPQRAPALRRAEAEDLARCATCPPRRSSTPPTPATSTRCRSCCTRRASTRSSAGTWASTDAARPVRVGGARRPGRAGRPATCRSASSASTSACPTPTCRWSRRSSTAGSTTAPSVEIEWIQAEDVEGLLAEGRLARPRRHRHPRRVRRAGHRGQDRRRRLRPRARHPVPRAVPRPADDDHRLRPQRARPERRQLHRDRPAARRTRSST